MGALFLDMDQVVAFLKQNPDSWTLGPHCEIESDPGQWGHSLANNTEILLPCLDIVGAHSVVEVGAYAGDVTKLLLHWAAGAGARVWAIDPSPQPSLEALDAERDDLELVRETSLEALPKLPIADAVVIDGDHNYYTVSEEIRLIAERATTDGSPLPLLLFHDVCWPHARRDNYFAPDQIPAEHRQPFRNGGVYPGDPVLRDDGLPYTNVAEREGGPRNGVLTAVEDFVSARDGLELAIVPTFFGLGLVWERDAPWASALADYIRPFDRNPVLARLEANRVLHLASMHSQAVANMLAGQRMARRDDLLRRLRDSTAFGVGEQISRLRQGGQPVFTRAEVEQLLRD